MDIAILSARIITGNPEQPWAEALGIVGNRIVMVGSNETVKAHITDKTEVIDMPGRLITPGLVDAHLHFLNFGMSLKWVNLRNLPSLDACREKIRQAVSEHKPGEWIIGRGWNQNKWEDSTEPTLKDLDDLTPQNPTMMVRACGHCIWINSIVLQTAGIDKDTPDPPGGQIDRDPVSGAPNGLLREARHLIEAHIPAPTLETRKEAMLRAQEEAHRHGLTGVHSCERLAQWEAAEALDKAGRLKIRIHHLLPPEEIEAASERGILNDYKSDHLWFGHVKFFADGSLGAYTALLHEPYADAPQDECGIACSSKEELREKAELAYRFGKDVAIHAIGDLAVTNCLEAIAAARKKYPGDRRDRIEHVQLVRSEDFEVFKEMDVVASVQPVFLPTDWQPAEKLWGAERCENAYAWKTIRDAGVRHQFGSDCPVEPIRPILGIQAAVTRQGIDGTPAGGWNPDQKLTLEETIEGFTKTAAWTARREADLGSIEPDKMADLTIFTQDLFETPPEQWHEVDVEMTVVNGEIVYRK
jgi:predicted amidohydrolase YtcJ